MPPIDPLQIEIERYQIRKDKLCEILMERETQFAEYQRKLHSFEVELLDQLAPLHQQLYRWEQRCLITKGIINRLEKMDWTDQELPTQMHPWVREIESTSTKKDISGPIEDKPKELSSEEQHEAKVLYKKLARRFHPDLVDIEQVQRKREEVMGEINEAYRSGDIEALRELEYYPDIRNPKGEAKGERWERLVREIALLEKKSTECNQLYEEVKRSELATLMTLSEQDTNPFEHIERILRDKIMQLQERWLRLRNREEKCWLQLDRL
jgi:hypothetical protein